MGPGLVSRYSDWLRAGWSRDRIPVEARFSATVQTGFVVNPPPVQWVPGLFPGGEALEAWRWPPTPSNAEVKERVELYLYSPSGPSWFFCRLNFTFTYIYIYIYLYIYVCIFFFLENKDAGRLGLRSRFVMHSLTLARDCQPVVWLTNWTTHLVGCLPVFILYSAHKLYMWQPSASPATSGLTAPWRSEQHLAYHDELWSVELFQLQCSAKLNKLFNKSAWNFVTQYCFR